MVDEPSRTVEESAQAAPTPGQGYDPFSGRPVQGDHHGPPPYPYGAPVQGPPGGYGPPGLGGQPPHGWAYPSPPSRRGGQGPKVRDHPRFLLGAVVAAVVALALGAGIGIGIAIAPSSPSTAAAKALFDKSLSAAAHAGTFHYVNLSVTDGQPDQIIGDASPNGGRQAITQRGPSGTDIIHLRLVNGVIYFQGNGPAVVDQLGVPASKASSVVNRWVEITRGQGPYETFAVGITTESNLAQLPTTFVPHSTQTVAGSSPPSTRIVGAIASRPVDTPNGTANLVIDSSSSLPKRLSAQAVDVTTGAHLSLSFTYSHWRQPVNVTAPAGAIAFSSLGVSSS